MFGFVTKFYTIYNSIKVLAAGFPDVLSDLETTFRDIEGFILTKSWNLAAVDKLIADAEQLYTDFIKNYTGEKSQIAMFLANVKALFA